MDGVCRRDVSQPLRLWFEAHYLPLLAAVFFLIFSFRFLTTCGTSDWGKCFVPAGLRMAAGESLELPYAYPPAMAMLSLPLVQLPTPVGNAAWYLINVLAACVAFTCSWRLAGGPPLTQLQGKWHAVLGLSLLLSGRFFIAPLQNTQFDMLIACLLLGGCCLLLQGRDLGAGLLLGAAAAMKCTPLLFFPYLLWRRRFRAALLMLAAAIVLNVLPDLFWPQHSGASYLADWYRTMLKPLENVVPGVWQSAIAYNQSLAGCFNRWVTNMASSADAPDLIRALTWGTSCLLLALTAWGLGSPLRAWPVLPRERLARDAALGACLMLLLSPMSSKAHYVVMILPAMLLARAILEKPSAGRVLLIGLLLLTGPLSASDLLGDTLADRALHLGFPTIFVLLCFAGLWSLPQVDDPAGTNFKRLCRS